jgi:hypothetical protein
MLKDVKGTAEPVTYGIAMRLKKRYGLNINK